MSGTPFPRYLEEMVSAPLGMSATAFDPLPGPLQGLRAVGYNPRGFSDYLEPAPPGRQIWAEGGLWSSVADMARWVGFQLGAYGPATAGDSVLDPSARRAMHTPRYLGDPDDWSHAMGISWHAIRRDDVIWVQHSGGFPGFTSTICFDPKTGVGAVALVNGYGDTPRMAMGLAEATRDAVVRRPPSIARPAPVPDAWRPLLGLYADDYSTARLEWRDGELTFVDPDNSGWRPRLVPTDDPNVFIVGPGCGQSGEKARFRRLPDGRVTSVLLASDTLRRLAPVTDVDDAPATRRE